jgi:exosortase/archaeosortase family protein
MNFKRTRNRIIMIAAGFPLAILGNISRLMALIIISEAFGQEVGMKAHDNTWFSLLPYVPPIIGIVLLGHWLHERPPGETVEKAVLDSQTKLQPTA